MVFQGSRVYRILRASKNAREIECRRDRNGELKNESITVYLLLESWRMGGEQG